MMVSSVVMLLLVTVLYNQANSAGIPTPPTKMSTSSSQVQNGNPIKRDATNNLDHKIQSLIESIVRMENSIQNLQEKSHTWSIFQHHIESWNDGLRTVENKLDILKRSHDDQQDVLNKLDLSLITAQENAALMDEIRDTLQKDQSLQVESSSKVNMIWRHLQTMQNNGGGKQKGGSSSSSSSTPSNKKKGNLMVSESSSSCNGTGKLLHTIIHQMAQQKDLKQLHSVDKRIGKNLETLTQSLPHVLDKQDEMVMRLQRSNECCYSLSSELTTFTESSDILLKRIERLINNVSEKLNRIEQLQSSSSEELEEDNTKENAEEESHVGDMSGIFVDVSEAMDHSNESSMESVEVESMDEQEEETVTAVNSFDSNESQTELYGQDVEFIRPELGGCHELNIDYDETDDDASTRLDGIYKFASPEINELERDFNERLCVFPTENSTGGLPWTVIQQRVPSLLQESFNRSWLEYRNGFGHLHKDFWFGNEFIHRLVYPEDYELRIELEDFEGKQVWAEYGIFRIDTEKYNYNLLIGDYRSTSTVADAMKYHNDHDFSTYDKRNDNTVDACCSCAVGYGSGWWFDNCSEANLNGIYHFTPMGHNYNGVMWELWHGDYSLKKTRMMVRPRSNNNESIDSPQNHESKGNEDP
ncbi:fibroleukin [Stomoxys calcitrans]|uniref:fibroleukin n=1 Tax=Stomoxys calcitrans TaxID=35570 RepID=UPI0027E33512|nr:fibroleukin [Stomoxys calcitrans]